MHKKAFTLIEIMVVISITALIGGMVVANMRSGGEVIDLKNTSQKLSEVIKQAQMMALSGKQISGTRIDGGYGVYINDQTSPSTYKLFINDHEGSNYAYDDGGDTVLREFELSHNINLESVDHYFIIFVPPGREIYVGTQSPGTILSGSTTIVLRHKINRYAYIQINSQGQINLLDSI
ncbi:MAG TPA: type II secretion system protein [Patescibacteria group bacterium]|nr:type II secretion system protein [Patescibacteria group bacterium]